MKVLVRFPDDLQERLLAFPFLHALYDHFSEDPKFELHILTAQKHIDSLYLLPFKAFYHEIHEEDLKSMFSMHRVAHNMKLESADYYFCLETDMKDASVGLSLQIKQRYGFEDGKGKWMLNKTVRRPVNLHKSEEYLTLLSHFTGKSYEKLRAIQSRRVEANLKDHATFPYMLVDLKVGADEQFDAQWLEFFSLLENKKVLLMMSSIGQDVAKVKIEALIKRLSPKNIYEFYYLKDSIDFAKTAAFATHFVGYQSAYIHIASYLGVRSFALFDEGDARNQSPLYSQGQVILFDRLDPAFKPIEKNQKINLEPVIDRLVSELL